MLDRLNDALEHVERHLDRPLDVAGLARIAATSEYHLRRLFSALAGMPLSEYVRRRRLTVAGAEVRDGGESLLTVAVRYGYGSTEAFARAFRAVHGVGPAEVRRGGAALWSQPRMAFRLVVEGSGSMRYRIEEKGAFHVVGWRARVPLVHEGMNPALVAFIRGLDQAAVAATATLSDQEPAGIVGASVGLAEDRAEGTALDYYHGVVTSAAVPADRDSLAVSAGQWAVFDSEGAFPEALQHLWRDVFTQWFPANPYRSRPGPEILRTRLSADGTRAQAQLWIPVDREPRTG